jgi:predicted phosphodiesterase
MLAVISDLHLGDGGPADDADPRGVYRAVEAALGFPVSHLVVNGDLVERWQFSLKAIIREQAGLLRWIDFQCYQRNVSIAVVHGNHDGANLSVLLTALRPVMPRSDLWGGEDVALEGWWFRHGHQFDVMNRPGPLQPIARGLTAFVGGIQRIAPGFREWWINPTAWISMARRSKGRKEILHLAAARWAKDRGVKALCIGHTHTADILLREGVMLANAGCLTRGHAEFAILREDGTGETVKLGREGDHAVS